MQNLESKYLRVTNETICALHATLSASSLKPGEDPDNYRAKAKRISSRFAAAKEPVTDRHLTNIVVQGLPESYRDMKLTTCKDPDFDLNNIQATMRHLYLDRPAGNETERIAGRETVVLAASEPNPVVACHHCGKDSHHKRGCAVPVQVYAKGKKPTVVHDKTRTRLEDLGESGARRTRRPHTTTPNTTRNGVRAQRRRRVARIRLLCWGVLTLVRSLHSTSMTI